LDQDPQQERPISIDSFAARCRAAREMIRVPRNAVGRSSKLSLGHYNRLELEQKQPTLAICRRVAAGMRLLGLNVTASWLAFGEGRPPTRIRKKKPKVVADA